MTELQICYMLNKGGSFLWQSQVNLASCSENRLSTQTHSQWRHSFASGMFSLDLQENSNLHIIDHCDSCLITNTKELRKTRSTRENLIRLPTSSNVSNCHTSYVIAAYDRSREKLFKLQTWEKCRFYGFISKSHLFNLVSHFKRTKMTNAEGKRFRINNSYLVHHTKRQSCKHAASKDCPHWIMKIKQKKRKQSLKIKYWMKKCERWSRRRRIYRIDKISIQIFIFRMIFLSYHEKYLRI